MDSAEWNETHKAPCTPHQRLYQTEINGRQHSLRGTQTARTNTVSWRGGWAVWGRWRGGERGLCESLIGLGCVCVRLASFNQVSPTANTGRQVMRFRQRGLSGGTKGGRSRGAEGPALPFGECLSVFQWSLKGLCPSSCKTGRREASKIPNCCRSTPNCVVYSRRANQTFKTENGMFFSISWN